MKEATSVDTNEDQQFKVCIIGAGAAGITLALRLARSGLSVALLEGGDLEMTERSQTLYEGASEGYAELDISRLRYFGGTTNHWTGYCRRPGPSDFAIRPWLPETGWPIKVESVDPYLEEAARIVEVASQFDVASWTNRLETNPLNITSADLQQEVSLVGPPVRFGEKYRSEIEATPEITCLTGANVVEIEANASGDRVSAVRVRSYDGKEFQITADYVVLACGGIENARLLLNSDSRIPGGLGNSSGTVGCFFADHAIVRAGQAFISPAASGIFQRPVWTTEDGNTLVPHLIATPEAAATAGVGRCALRANRRNPGQRSFTDRLFSKVSDYLPFGDDAEPEEYELLAFAEPIPNINNRMTLSDERDAMGMRKINLIYQPHELEMQAVEHVVKLFGAALGAAGIGRAQIDTAPFEERFFDWGYHHYGTTRMSADHTSGVVDADLKVHGLDNLYIAGTSVYPNGGIMTPTMTLVALTLRLGDTLEKRML
ncbi:FAD-dependent oxidoreductase [Paracoccus beibuensis]|uniref:FAD-dependent oxidoreductase n=1 Tax=Paracoccus beibuensis TaxID=547602 RepID=UPI00223EF128|nr:GMC family oxidoreductase [Paracoccus beibuensis]